MLNEFSHPKDLVVPLPVLLAHPTTAKKEIVVLSIFILHSRESELYCNILDGTYALAWELPFSRCLGHLFST